MNQHHSLTKKNYYAVWKIVNEFFIRLDNKPRKWEDRLTLFIGHLVQQNRQSSTVKSYISAIKAVLKMNSIKVTEDQFLLSSLTRACHLRNDRICTRLPIQKRMLTVLLKGVKNHFWSRGQPYLAALYQTMLSSCYFGLLRVSEVCSGSGMHLVLVKDMHITTNKMKFVFVTLSIKSLSFVKISASEWPAGSL